MEASFIEIYNETLRDLLSIGRKEKSAKHEIRIDSKNLGEVYVTNITPISISSEEQVDMHGHIQCTCCMHVHVHVYTFAIRKHALTVSNLCNILQGGSYMYMYIVCMPDVLVLDCR